MGARVVEGTGLENRQGFTLLVGSNPTPSANGFGNGSIQICGVLDATVPGPAGGSLRQTAISLIEAISSRWTAKGPARQSDNEQVLLR